MRESLFVKGFAESAKKWVTITSLCLVNLALAGCPAPHNDDEDDDEVPVIGVAPGLNIEILGVFVPGDGRPEVNFQATDDNGNIIPLVEITDARFILAVLQEPEPGSTERFASYTTEEEDAEPFGDGPATHAAYDAARLGGVTQNADGTLTYKFDAVLPNDFDPSVEHQLGGQFRRLWPVDNQSYVENVAFPFRPDGGAVAKIRDIVSTESCNQCHTRLSEHGNIRRDIQLCILCHTPQSTDANSGNTVNFPEMIHKIHYGEDLPSVQDGDPYRIFGFRDSINDYSTVAFPQDVRNCATCHSGAPDADTYLTTPTSEGCASCHDRTWFGDRDLTPEGFTNHPGGTQVSNALCAQCHSADAVVAPVDEVHRLPTETPNAVGLVAEITGVQTFVQAKGATMASAQVDFHLEDNSGAAIDDLSVLNILAATVAYPVPEFQTNVRENLFSSFGQPADGTLENLGGGDYRYTFAEMLPLGTGQTFAVGIEGRRPFDFRGMTEQQGIESNPVTFFTVDGGMPEQRRMVVSQEKCNVCHKELREHGTLRSNINYCVMCHNVNGTDNGRREEFDVPGPPETINFKNLIHAIHRGEELNNPFTVIGFGGNPFDATEIRFSGLEQDCSICHIDDDTAAVPTPPEALSTMIAAGGTIFSDVLPQTAACASCHDGDLTVAHANVNTFNETETCAVCHGPGAEFEVSAVHALAP